MTNKKFLAIWVPILAVFTVFVIIANIAIGIFDKWIEGVLGAGTYTVNNSEQGKTWDTSYYTADYASTEEHEKAAAQLIEDIAGEGIVLAKNVSSALPLKAGAHVTMLGRAAADPIYGGSGSGSVDTTSAVNARAGLENSGFSVNEVAYQTIAEYAKANRRAVIEMDKPEISSYNIGELPVTQYEAIQSTFADYKDAALVYIGRGGGEGGDLTRDMNGWDDNYTPGQHQLELNKDELDLLNLAKEHFETVVVVVNASTPIEMAPIQNDSAIDAVLLIGSPGLSGFNAVGKVLSGEINPSGRTTDIWAADFTQDPTYVNFGHFAYDDLKVSYPSNVLSSVASNAKVSDIAPFVNYQEGIYVGYRYWETAAAEQFINYDQAVVYPFGYGLSYTNFEWKIVGTHTENTDGTLSVDVEVTNTGNIPGKEVVELYYTAPYTRGGIEKPEVVLGAFAKTDLIAAGSSQTVTLTMRVEDMASYDYKNAHAYVLEAGEYTLSVRTNSHTVAPGTEPVTYTVKDTIIYDDKNPRSHDKTAATNRFDDVSSQFTDEASHSGKIVNMSRADFAGTFPQVPEGDLLHASEAARQGFAVWDHKAVADSSKASMPKTGAKTDLTLVDLRGLSYEDPKWDELLDSLHVSDMTSMLLNGAYTSAALPSIAKPKAVDLDGPAGFSSFINSSVNGPAYPSEFTIAQTWNVKLAQDMGVMMGNESLLKKVSGWYAPAMNLHRSPFAGRNFEYYSEDPYLSGAMAAATSQGAATKGLYTTLKHFALNDQETNRSNNGVAVWANEQAIRELYLKPFEMAIKEVKMPVTYISDKQGTRSEMTVGATAVMSSYNRIGATWAGGNKALMTDVLRGEWGFEGFAISDFNLNSYMSPDQSIEAGTDLTLAFAPSKSFADTTSAHAVSNIRHATKNILFAVVNSNAMDGQAPGATVSYTPPTWKYIQWGVTGVCAVIIVLGAYGLLRRCRKHSAATVSVETAVQN
ncbi:glycoside hydrolase family 3 N-terminal domain-containing protein [Schaalia sp. lx-100]|uniref:glycoside hydrolase family 3 N-terminal domain-containing protein n=1 Tax=Schaalia sp. lx-100 TaxID=2899081 RepID=UPI001E3A8208|nr:glycoside hydrolase family 3 N-terminal domain-containing protein [Schaalia sp. lx-100]MCD4558207.1 glycoside hydrolase family 3 C-terminal domain-containing protein [Schaalia sp. lx-100]